MRRGECGACTVLLDGEPVNSVPRSVRAGARARVKTIEGLKGRMRCRRRSSPRAGAQCGICTPGMIPAAAALPEEGRAGGDPDRPRRQPLPLHRIRRDLPRDPKGCAEDAQGWRMKSSANLMRTAITRIRLLEPRSVKEALRMLRDEGPLDPLAGCTDVYVNLNFGTVEGQTVPEPLAAWTSCAGSRCAAACSPIGALATYTQMIRSPPRTQAAADPRRGGARDRGRPDPEPRDARRQHRQRSPGRRHAAGPGRRRGGPRAGERRRDAAGPVQLLLHGLPQERERPDELIAAVEIPAVAGPPVVPEGRHARRAGDLEGRDGGRSARRSLRIALGSVAPTVIRLPETEAVPRGRRLDRRRRRSARPRDPADRRPALDGRVPAPRLRPTCSNSSGARRRDGRDDASTPEAMRHPRPRDWPRKQRGTSARYARGIRHGGSRSTRSTAARRSSRPTPRRSSERSPCTLLVEFAPNAETFGAAVGLPAASRRGIYTRVLEKLRARAGRGLSASTSKTATATARTRRRTAHAVGRRARRRRRA